MEKNLETTVRWGLNEKAIPQWGGGQKAKLATATPPGRDRNRRRREITRRRRSGTAVCRCVTIKSIAHTSGKILRERYLGNVFVLARTPAMGLPRARVFCVWVCACGSVRRARALLFICLSARLVYNILIVRAREPCG